MLAGACRLRCIHAAACAVTDPLLVWHGVRRAACPRNNLRLGGTFLTIERAVATNGHSHHNASALTGARAGSGGASGRRSQRRLRAAWRIDAGPGPGPAAGVESGREDASMPLHGAEAEPVWWAVHTDDDWCTKFHWHR